MAMSTCPLATALHARKKAVEEEAQAFSTLMMVEPSSPVPRSITWPRIIS